MTATPTSAKTAIHMFAMPKAASTSTANLVPRAKMMFCHTMRMVRRATSMAFAMSSGLSFMSTMSAASMAASDPMAPMAMPMSARVSTGASLMPSPTKASLPLPRVSRSVAASSFSTSATLSWGNNSACTSSMPSRAATEAATSVRSPVSMTVFFTPAACKSAMARAAVGLMVSAMTMVPRKAPSAATYSTVPAASVAWKGTAWATMSLPLPTSTPRPSTTASTPWPLTSRTSRTRSASGAVLVAGRWPFVMASPPDRSPFAMASP